MAICDPIVGEFVAFGKEYGPSMARFELETFVEINIEIDPRQPLEVDGIIKEQKALVNVGWLVPNVRVPHAEPDHSDA